MEWQDLLLSGWDMYPWWSSLCFDFEVTVCMIVASHLGVECKAPPPSYFETPCFVWLGACGRLWQKDSRWISSNNHRRFPTGPALHSCLGFVFLLPRHFALHHWLYIYMYILYPPACWILKVNRYAWNPIGMPWEVFRFSSLSSSETFFSRCS